MSEADVTSILANPLAEATREERRNLIIASAVGAVVGLLGLVPTKISALGVEFDAPAQRNFVLLAAAVVAYFFVAFLIYAISDWFSWWKKYQDHLIQQHVANESWTQEDQRKYDELHSHVPKMSWLVTWSKPVVVLRITFEFAVPLAAGAFSIWSLVRS